MNGYIKIFDRNVATELESSGFSFTTERINNQEVFVFENTPELMNVLDEIRLRYFDEIVVIEESTLNF